MKRVRRYAPKLPHERDESVSAPAAPTPAIDRARRDLADGQKDTDSYTRANATFEQGPKAR